MESLLYFKKNMLQFNKMYFKTNHIFEKRTSPLNIYDNKEQDFSPQYIVEPWTIFNFLLFSK